MALELTIDDSGPSSGTVNQRSTRVIISVWYGACGINTYLSLEAESSAAHPGVHRQGAPSTQRAMRQHSTGPTQALPGLALSPGKVPYLPVLSQLKRKHEESHCVGYLP
jgi:hypothetical protein